MAKLPAADPGATASENSGFPSLHGPSGFQRELERARRHLAKLEAEQARYLHASAPTDRQPHFDESPAFVRTCNLLIWAIIVAPIALAIIAAIRRLAG